MSVTTTTTAAVTAAHIAEALESLAANGTLGASFTDLASQVRDSSGQSAEITVGPLDGDPIEGPGFVIYVDGTPAFAVPVVRLPLA